MLISNISDLYLVAKTIIIKLPKEIIADFQVFPKIQDERAYLYQNATKKINDGIGDVFIKKTVNLKLIKNNKPVIEPSTLDEINFDTTELSSNDSWMPKDIAGKLESFEFVVGDLFWDKICKWAKLSSILNGKFNASVLENSRKILSELKSDAKVDPNKIKQVEQELVKTEKDINEFMVDECLASYVHELFVRIIIEKIKATQQELLDKEFEELNKPKKESQKTLNS